MIIKEQPVSRTIVSIIIPVFNNINFTKFCLKTLNELLSPPGPSGIDFKIVVVDDGSKDGTAEWIKENFPDVHLLFGNGNLWWSGGINMGVAYAFDKLETDYILWWNNDIKPKEDYFLQVEKLIRENEDNVLIGSKIFILNKDIIWGMGGKFDPVTGVRFMYGGLQDDSDKFRRPIEVDWFPGMGTIIHRQVFEKIGMLDFRNFPQYHGDSDFTYRAKKAGFKLIAFPELVIYNDNSNTGLIHSGTIRNLFKSLTSVKSNFNIKKEVTFYRKHSQSPLAYLYVIRNYFRYIGGFFKWKFLNSIGIKKS